MAKVPLRKYTSEIETLIEGGRTEEAIAHCRHVLKTFPKYLEIYRLLGKAYLESRHHSEASDIFNRILMAVPDDFVSHVGLSIIADEAKRLNDAIWHMERAFEKQPSNAAIQAELQRLYGQRDGREPPKIRLTRGALAHMYYQGELYPQAVSEIRSVMAEEPSRVDLQSLLALVYFRGGQKVEASEACTHLLDQFPYHFDANRILVEILPGTGMADSAGGYRKRVVELDPYAAHVSGSIFRTEEAPTTSVTIERLEYTGQPAETAAWSGALGADESKLNEPEWMKSGWEAEPAYPSSSTFGDALGAPPATVEAAAPAPAESQPAAAEDDIPNWMRAAGWGASTGAFDESAASVVQEEPAADELEKADLPDWIKSMAPPMPEPSAPSVEAAAPDEDMMDWLNKLGGDHPFESAVEPEAPVEPAAKPAEVPNWLAEMESKEPSAPTTDSLRWLDELKEPEAQPPAAVSPAAVAGLANWLSKPEEPSAKTPALEQPPKPVETPSAPSAPSVGLGSLGTSAAEQDAALAWLESLAAKQGAKSEELITDPNARLEKPPEWVEQAKAVGEAQPEAPAPAPEQPPVSMREMEKETQPEPPAPEQPPAWVSDFGQKEEQLPQPVESAPWPGEVESAPVSGVEGWLRNLEAEESKARKPVEAEAAPWSGEIEIAPPAPLASEAVSEVELPSWLRGLESREPEPPPARTEELPDWLKGEEPEVPTPPARTRAADWTPEAPKPIPQPAPKPERKTPVRAPKPQPTPEPVEPTKIRKTGMLMPVIDPTLAAARDAMSHGKIPDALQYYGNLIRKGKLLEDITFDLKEALYRFPVEVSIWQVLGDAYMRANRLQDALDAYTKAEELLR